MLARRLPLIWVFAGGCISGAALLGIFRSEDQAVTPPKEENHRARTAERSVPAMAASDAIEDDTIADEPAVAEAPSPVDDGNGDAPAEAGSSVADLLARLEAAYREGLAAAATESAPASTSTAMPAAEAPVREEPAVVAAAPVPVPLPAPAAPPVSTPPAAAPAEPAAVVAAADTARQGDVHIGDVNQNTTNIGNLQQGDLYLLQQLAYIQYFRPVPVAVDARASAPTPAARGASSGFSAHFVASGKNQNPQFFVSVNGGHRVSTPGAPTFSFPIINPDNPWGYDFPPPVLVK